MNDATNDTVPLPPAGDAPLWKRVLFSPVVDLVRGRVTGPRPPWVLVGSAPSRGAMGSAGGAATGLFPFTVAAVVSSANLPEPLGRLVHDVVGRTRLWHRERVEVAHELVAHFRDGLDAGATAEHLAQRFGDASQVAQLIRRARIRNRHWTWQAWRWGVRGCAALVAFVLLSYGVLAARHFTARPVIARDYLAERNELAKQIPEADRAWVMYRQALVKHVSPKPSDEARFTDFDTESPPDDPAWPKMVEYVKQNQEAIELIRQGAARPKLGFRYNDPGDAEWLTKVEKRDTPIPDHDTPVWETLLPHIQHIRLFARLLAADCRVALHEGDGDRLTRNFEAMSGLVDHPTDADYVIAGLVSVAILNIELALVDEVLVTRPELLSDARWVSVAHRIAQYGGGGTIRLSLDGERKMMDDLFQRIYSDDGRGDGRLTPEGMQLLQDFDGVVTKLNTPSGRENRVLLAVAGPLMGPLMASRREQRELAMRLVDRGETERAGPLHTWPESSVERELHEKQASVRERIRYLPTLLFLPALQQVAMAGERTTQQRDALLTAIALELYRRKHDGWPATLDRLVPRYLPALPIDRFTGKTLTYTLRDSKPLLYAWGMDEQDDGGRPPRDDRGQTHGANFGSEIFAKPQKPRAAGKGFDWVLFPRDRNPLPPPEPDDKGLPMGAGPPEDERS